MPLQDLIGLRQSNPAAVFLGREVELEYLFVHILRNAGTLILNLGDGGAIVGSSCDGQHATFGHGLDSVDNYIQESLLHQIDIDLHRQSVCWCVAFNRDTVLFGVGRSQLRDVL